MKIMGVFVASLFTLAGCNAGPVIADGEGVTNTPANRSVWTPDGQVETTLQGMAPANVETSATGANVQSSGQPRVLTISMGEGENPIVFTLVDPSDTNLQGFRFDAKAGTIGLDAFGASASAVLAVQNEAIIQSLLTTEKITAEQASVIRQAIQSGASLAEAVAKALAPAIIPVP